MRLSQQIFMLRDTLLTDLISKITKSVLHSHNNHAVRDDDSHFGRIIKPYNEVTLSRATAPCRACRLKILCHGNKARSDVICMIVFSVKRQVLVKSFGDMTYLGNY